MDAVAYGQQFLAPLRAGLGPESEASLRDVVALLAYGDPEVRPHHLSCVPVA